MCRPKVGEARDGALLVPGQVYLAPGGDAHLEVAGRGKLRCRLRAGDPVSGHRPSVDVLFDSVAASAGAAAVGAILTGMGRDGASGPAGHAPGRRRHHRPGRGHRLVYGMPRAAFEIGAVERQLPLARIGPEICACAGRRSQGR